MKSAAIWENKLLGRGMRTMMRKILDIDKLAASVKPSAKKYNAEEVYVFGSYARGESALDKPGYQFTQRPPEDIVNENKTGGICYAA